MQTTSLSSPIASDFPLPLLFDWWAHRDDLGGFRTVGALLFPNWKPGKLCLPLKKERHASASRSPAASSTAMAVSPKTFTATASSLHPQSINKLLIITHHEKGHL